MVPRMSVNWWSIPRACDQCRAQRECELLASVTACATCERQTPVDADDICAAQTFNRQELVQDVYSEIPYLRLQSH